MSRSPLTLLGWRRAVAALYGDVRDNPHPAAAHARWRSGRDQLFATHPDSPLSPDQRAAFGGLPVAPYDPAYRFVSELRPAPAHRFETATGTDGLVAFERIGTVRLGDLGEIDVWWLAGYGGGVFVPLRDGLAGTSAYSGGRYVIDTVKGADLGGTGDGLVIDCNFAYNPSCAYDPAWACPLAPEGNRIDAPVPVGELLPEGGW